MPDPRVQLRTALAHRYTIHHELGRGGMATVYLATDLRNRRRVALKILADDVISTISIARFLREIEIAGRLDHPHILPLLDSGAADGLAYYTMPYVDGESLRERLRREKQLPLEDAVRIAREVADALSHAHARGIIHRDIKPDNILLADGHARVADFGIARAIGDGTDGSPITATGLAIGTPAYMSPEQLSGSKELDQRSDVYSLGCVLYEMLAGEAPYTGANAQAILAKRLRDPVPRVTVLRETVPPQVERAIGRALARAPADRFANASAFADALTAPHADTRAMVSLSARRRMVAGLGVVVGLAVGGVLVWQYLSRTDAPAGDPNVIAVIPFRVHAQDSSALYLREGILDYLSAQLTGDGVPRAVDSRTVLLAWKHATQDGRRDPPPDEILSLARRLGAGRLLLGEIVETTRGTTVSGRILDGRGIVLAERTESGPDDPLLLVDRLAARLLARNAGETEWRLPRLSDSLEAVKEYLAGMHAHRTGEYEKSKVHLDRALEIDSTFALAAMRAIRGGAPVAEMLERTARAWRLRERLSPRDRAVVEAHFGLGPNYPGTSNTTERLQAHERAASLNPDAADVLERFGTDLLVYGLQVGVADAQVRAAELLDSALALDSSYGPAAQWRLLAALALDDTAAIRHLTPLEERLNPQTTSLGIRWSGLAALGDTAGLARLSPRIETLPGNRLAGMLASAANHRLPTDDLERSIVRRLENGRSSELDRRWYLRGLFHTASLQGRVADALAISDSLVNWDLVLAMSIAEPGYDSAAAAVVRLLDQVADTALDADGICYRELWRVKHGDSTATRRSIRRMRALVREYPPAPIPRVGRFGVCALLLDVLVARSNESALLPALQRLEAVLRSGVGLELPGELATLLVTRLRFERGDYGAAYDIVRRRPYIQNIFFTVVLPAHLREEGRLAAILGDTAAAIRAYRHYLALRKRPDSGLPSEDVTSVREHLDALLQGSNR